MENQKQKSSNKKIFWIIFSVILSIAVVYMFVVIYFYYISPNNISLKLALWPFNTDESVGNMYVDATVQVDFEVQDPENGQVSQKSIVGINVKEEGVIVTVYDQLRYLKSDSEITINTNNGIFSGNFVYGDINYNLAILKCENKSGRSGKISLPYVKIASEYEISETNNLFIISSPKESKKVRSGALSDTTQCYMAQRTVVYTDVECVDFVMKNCYLCKINEATGFTSGIILNRTGSVYGLSVGYTDVPSETNMGVYERLYVFVPTYEINNFLDKALGSYKKDKTNLYKNDLLVNLKVVDLYDMTCHKEINEEDGFYFSETRSWKEYTTAVEKFIDYRIDGVFLIDDLVLNEDKVLEANSVLVSIKIGGTTYKIYDKLSLANVLYKTTKGQTITLNYCTITSDYSSPDHTEDILSKQIVL